MRGLNRHISGDLGPFYSGFNYIKNSERYAKSTKVVLLKISNTIGSLSKMHEAYWMKRNSKWDGYMRTLQNTTMGEYMYLSNLGNWRSRNGTADR